MNRRTFLGLSGVSMLPSFGFTTQPTAPANPIIEIATGRIRGVVEDGVHVFRGVPYGAPTGGSNRFLPAKPAPPWTGVFDARQYGPRAYQPFRPMIREIGDALTGSGPMSEDCLRLNIWTPAISAGRRPVMVWFHGGGQRTGSGNSIFYDGRALAGKHDVVVVTTTHRLNAFAYLWLAGLTGTGEQFADTANLGFATSCSHCNGCATTSDSSAATPETSRSSASRAAAERRRCSPASPPLAVSFIARSS